MVRTRRQRTGADHLPTELLEMIVQNLHKDRKALKTCSLLSRKWLSLARPHLHREAFLRGKEDLKRWKALIKSCPAIATRYLKSVEVYSEQEADRGFFLKMPPLPSVTELKWLGGLWRVTKDLRRFVGSFPSLEVLEVSGPFASPATLQEFLLLFSRLKSVSFSALNCGMPIPLLRSSTKFDVSQLERVAFGLPALRHHYDFDDLALFMLETPSTHNLKSLSVECDSVSNEAITAVLASCAHSLEHFKLSPPSDLDHVTKDLYAQYELPKPHIPALPKLRRIGFGPISEHKDSDHTFPILGWVLDLIGEIGPREQVSAIQLHFYVDMEADSVEGFFNCMDWKPTTEALAKAFPNAQEVVVRITTEVCVSDALARTYEERLQGDWAQSGLHVCIDWDDGSLRHGNTEEMKAKLHALLGALASESHGWGLDYDSADSWGSDSDIFDDLE